jgi:N-acetylmannosamine-6-phosphate 2-epimerase/N-acetylmannosamine kinase
LGISTGGTVDPETGTVVEAKPLIPNHISTVFTEETLGVPTVALNDGLATAWAHGMHPDYAGKRVITLALGTGVGCGWVENGRLHMDRHGNYPRLNDLPWQGQSIEDAMGGASIAEGSTDWAVARSVLRSVVHWIQALLLPEVILIGGGVGLSRELENERRELHLIESPFGENAGLEGALALVRYPIPPAVTFPLRPSHTITS